jgi:Ca2+/Na+ antiporter
MELAMISPPALIGAVIFLTALGLGVSASIMMVRRAQGPKERVFVLRISIISWAIILSLLATAYFLRPPWMYIVLAFYFIVCPTLVYRWSTKHQLIRVLERREHDDDAKP